MSRFHRKTAPGVRNGRVQRTNNWERSPNPYTHTPARLVIDRRRPGAGYRHLLLKRDIERFVALIPNWDKLALGLEVICLDHGRDDCDGWYNRGVLGVCAWSERMRYELRRDWYRGHRAFLERIGARVEVDETGDAPVIHWTDDTARAYQLCHVFLHELGHHADRMHTRTKRDSGPRGEPFAEGYAFDLEAAVLERYFAEFGLPD
ncbi:hypothetical protein R5W24_002520 [Gemmata sp. JC717]|uniref:hypothetical protein n=1 Tax=Gemmata algarum TaxID=2975278 RepID=UPI0021BB7537|nr:hypothetical protein [Gemmata algarum]MDY3553419.1 hypothetical protein [Gemmata algarum]